MTSPIQNQRGSGLIVALVITGLIAIMMIALLERLVPSSRNVRGVENSVVAYYLAGSAIEQALATLQVQNPGHMADTDTTNTNLENSYSNGSSYAIAEAVQMIPEAGKGTSEYDSNWSIVGPGKPVQLYIPASFTTEFVDAVIDLRVPSVSSTDTLAGESTLTQFFTGSNTYTVGSLLITNGVDTLLPITSNASSCPSG